MLVRDADILVDLLDSIQVDVTVASAKVVDTLGRDSALLKFVASKFGALSFVDEEIPLVAGRSSARYVKISVPMRRERTGSMRQFGPQMRGVKGTRDLLTFIRRRGTNSAT